MGERTSSPDAAPAPEQGAPPGRGTRDVTIAHGALPRGRRTVLRAGEVRAPAGSTVALVGGNGAGKSTLLMAAADVLLGARATIAVCGRRVRAVAYVPQRPALPPWLSVRASAALHGADPALLSEAARRLDMAALLDRRADRLSSGQLQALAVAIALATPRPIVLLDEPFAAVDLARRPILRRLVAERGVRVPGGATVLSSHVAADLARLCDWIVVLRDGGYAYQGTTRALVQGTSALAEDAPVSAEALERAVAALLAPAPAPGHSPL